MKAALLSGLLLLVIAATAAFCSAAEEHKFSDDISAWIAAPSSAPTANLFRSPAFSTPAGPIQTAIVYWSTAGFGELHVNGHRARAMDGHEARMEPGTTSFAKRSLFVAYDVSAYLRPNGTALNVISFQVGNGWWGMKRAFNRSIYLRAELVVNGQAVAAACTSSSSWIVAQGPIARNSIYFGEEYNASLEMPGWSSSVTPPTSYLCSGSNVPAPRWAPARAVPASEFSPKLELRKFPGERVVKTLRPVNSWMADSRNLVVDFGVYFAGTISIASIKGTRGSLRIRTGEILDHYAPGRSQFVYFANLRSAQNVDIFHIPVCASSINNTTSGAFRFSPVMDYRGGRFAQINTTEDSDIDLSLIAQSIVGLQINTDLERTGTYKFDDDVFNKIMRRAEGATITNLQSYPTDTSDRDERLGWSADAYLAGVAEFLLYDLSEFTINHLQNIADDQVNGEIPDVVPFVRYGSQLGDPSWGQVGPELLTDVYAETADLQTLATYFNSTLAWIHVLESALANQGFSSLYFYYGDWVPPSPAARVNGHFCSNFALLWQVNLARQLCVANDSIVLYTALTALMRNSYLPGVREVWYDASTQQWAGSASLQASYVFPLAVPGLFSDTAAHDNLLSMVDHADGGHFNVGILSLRLVFNVLAHQLGRPDVAAQMLLFTSYPSYAYEWSGDAETPTTASLWEVWDAPVEGPGMNSRDHAMDSSVVSFLAAAIGGMASATSAIRALNMHAEKASFAQLRALHAKYAGYGTIVLDLSMANFDSPVRAASARRKIGKKQQPKSEITFSWKKTGGDMMCQQYETATVFGENKADEPLRAQQQPLLTCGGDSSKIAEVIEIMIGNPNGASCSSLYRNTDKLLHAGSKSLPVEQRAYLSIEEEAALAHLEREAASKLRRLCVGRESCDVSAAFGADRRDLLSRIINNRTTSIVVRARCSTPARVHAQLRMVKNRNSNQQQQQEQHHQQRFELFVPTFGFRQPRILITKTDAGDLTSFQVESNVSVVSSHPMLHIVSRGRALQRFAATASPSASLLSPVTLIHGFIDASSCKSADDGCGIDITVHEGEAQSAGLRFAVKKSSSAPLSGLGSRSKVLHFGSCGTTKKVIAVDRIDMAVLSAQCRQLVSSSKLLSAVELECVAAQRSECIVPSHEMVMSHEPIMMRKTRALPNRCVAEIENAVVLRC